MSKRRRMFCDLSESGRDNESGHVFEFISHVLMAAAVFLTVLTVAWGVGVFVHWLEGIHPFNPTALKVLLFLEYAVLVLDAALALTVLALGVVKFVRRL